MLVCLCCVTLVLEPINLHNSAIKMKSLHVCFSNSYYTGCRPLNSPTTSSNDNNCNNTTITTITNRIIIRICMAQLDPSHRHARSLQTQWHFKWHPTTLRCINRTLSFSRRQMASICISLLAAHAICLTAVIIISSMELTLTMTPCYSHPANVRRSWINNRIIAKSHLNSPTRNRLCKLHPRAPTLQMATLMSRSARHHQAALISRLSSSSKTAANYWTAWIRSTTATQIRPINIFWSPTKLVECSYRTRELLLLYELTRKTIFWYDF